jgi:hypothetical protein
VLVAGVQVVAALGGSSSVIAVRACVYECALVCRVRQPTWGKRASENLKCVG